MSLATAIAIYFLIWWVVLFAILPFGIRSQHESGPVSEGTDPGAPTSALVWRRLLWTTIVSAIVFAGFAVVYINRWITLDSLAAMFGSPW
jgi:predicted secreted protein